MSLQPIDTLKSWFETGDYPTQQQFWDLIDSFIHKGEGISVADVDGLTELLQAKADANQLQALQTVVLLPAGATTYTAAAGTLVEAFVILPGTAIDFAAGSTNGGVDIVETINTGGDAAIFRVDRFCTTNTTFYFSGIQPTTQIKILKR